MTFNPEADLRARWLPSAEQMAHADALLAHTDLTVDRGGWTEYGVYTTHLLVNKEHGWWGDGIEVRHLDGIFTSRDAAQRYLADEARRFHEETGKKVSGGYAWHPEVGHAAVFEDSMAQFPEPDYRSKKGTS